MEYPKEDISDGLIERKVLTRISRFLILVEVVQKSDLKNDEIIA